MAGEESNSTGHNLFKLLESPEPLFLPQQTATQSLALVSLVEHQTPACHTPARTSRACCMSLLNKQSILWTSASIALRLLLIWRITESSVGIKEHNPDHCTVYLRTLSTALWTRHKFRRSVTTANCSRCFPVEAKYSIYFYTDSTHF